MRDDPPDRGTPVDALWRLAMTVGYRVVHVWWFLRRPSVEGAYVIVRRPRTDGEWELLLVRNSYKRGYSPPCGGLRRGERPVDGAARELLEEVGLALDASSLEPAGVVALDLLFRHDRAHFFDVTLPADSRPRIRVDNREVVWADFVAESEARALPLTPHFEVWLERHAPWR